jgi:hypothetical protein
MANLFLAVNIMDLSTWMNGVVLG